MKANRLVLALLTPLAFSLALAGEASAKGACVYLQNESFQCVDTLSSQASCSQKASGGEFHEGTTCRKIGHGVTWGLAAPPPPPAKPSFERASYAQEMPVIPSPISKRRR